MMDCMQSFIRGFWDDIKYDLEKLFDVFHKGGLNVERLNHGNIALIPKATHDEVI